MIKTGLKNRSNGYFCIEAKSCILLLLKLNFYFLILERYFHFASKSKNQVTTNMIDASLLFPSSFTPGGN